MTGASPAVALKTDLEFHLEISRATGNPLFSILLEALSRFVLFGQIESCKNDPKRRKRAIEAHAAIAEAIANSDAERARAEMESHLLYSAARIVDSMQDPTS
jgi:GntR family transcriptional repressor for pyruvate dehydrogenase complex